MIQHYFQSYDKMIFPHKFKPSQLKSKLNENPAINQHDNENNEIEDCKLCFKERKNNMFLRLENSQEQKKIDQLQKEILGLSEENLKLKNELSNNADYILKMEKMIQKLKIDNYNKYKSKFEHEINKKKFGLNFENSLSNISNENKINFDEYEKIKNENKSLKLFKNNIFNLSKNFDEINNELKKYLNKIREFFDEINKKYLNKINDDFMTLNYDFEIENYQKIHDNINNIFDIIKKFMKIKHDEYKILLDSKEIKINELKNNIKNLQEKNLNLNEQIFNLTNSNENLKNEVEIFKDIYNENNKKKYEQKKKELNKSFNKMIKNDIKNNVKNQMTRAKRSLIRTKFSFENNLQPNLKKEMLNKINKTKLL